MREEKQLLLDEVQNHLKKNDAFLIMRYKGLTANKANEFRGDLAKKGGFVEIVRKRILLKAAKAAGVELDLEALEGHIGIIMAGEDPLDTAKFVFKFGQDNDKAVEVLGGRFEGQLYNAAEMETLSKLPGRDEMRAQLLSALEAPMSQTLGVMDAVLSSVVYCLDNKCKQASEDNN